MTTSVQEHYGTSEIVARILAAVPWSAENGSPLKAEMLFPYDQLHGRELFATRDHAARLNPSVDEHVLDIGSGVGGPARYFASTFGCQVTGVDLTPEFVSASVELARLSGLADRAVFVEADAVAMPFPDASFDHAYSFYVGMNLPDKSAVLRECHRVLKPGGRLIWTEVTQVTGAPHYPLPWAKTAETSHVEPGKSLVGHFRDAGFDILVMEDETGSHLELAQKMKASGRVPSIVQTQVNEVVLGADFVERRMNYIRSLGEGFIASTLVDARKPI